MGYLTEDSSLASLKSSLVQEMDWHSLGDKSLLGSIVINRIDLNMGPSVYELKTTELVLLV